MFSTLANCSFLENLSLSCTPGKCCIEPSVTMSTMEPEFIQGIHLFNSQRYFEAHEALEAVWLKATGDRRTLLHGLIQAAAAFHHYTRNNSEGFHSLLEKGHAKLASLGNEFEGLDLAAFTAQLQPWRDSTIANSLPLPEPPLLPQIRLTSDADRN